MIDINDIPTLAQFEDQVTTAIENDLGVCRSDAQAIVEANAALLHRLYVDCASAADAADLIANV